MFYLLFLCILSINNNFSCNCCCNGNSDKKYNDGSSTSNTKPIINNDDNNDNNHKQNISESNNNDNLEYNTKDNLQNRDTHNEKDKKYNENINKLKADFNNFKKNALTNLKNTLLTKNEYIKQLADEELYLIHVYTQANDIKNIESIQIEGTGKSQLRCKKITLNNNKTIYIKGNKYSPQLFYDLLHEIDLLDFKYYFSLNYVLSEHVNQNIDNEDLNQEILDMDKNLDTAKLNDMLSKIKNFKEYNFFCSLLRLGDCNLIYRLDNSYFKEEGDKYRVFLLDVDYPDEVNRISEGESYSRFYSVLNSKITFLKFIDKYSLNSSSQIFLKHKEITSELLVALSISLTLYENEQDFLDENTITFKDFMKKYSTTNIIGNPKQIIHFKLEDKNFVSKYNEGYLGYKTTQVNTNNYPTNIILTIKYMFENFKNTRNDILNKDIENKFLEYILPLLYTHLGIEEKCKDFEKECKDPEKKCSSQKKALMQAIETIEKFKDTFLKNYELSKNLIISINNYYKIQKIIKPELFDTLMNVDTFTNEENKEIKTKLIKLINFIKQHETEYDSSYIGQIKGYFNFLKIKNMFPNIISDINF